MYTKKFEATTYAVFNNATCGNYGAMIQFFSNSQLGCNVLNSTVSGGRIRKMIVTCVFRWPGASKAYGYTHPENFGLLGRRYFDR
jgi:hypothetical protein